MRHAVVADGEVDERALRLRAPIVFGGDVDGPHRVSLGAEADCTRPDGQIKHAGWLRGIVFAHDTFSRTTIEGPGSLLLPEPVSASTEVLELKFRAELDLARGSRGGGNESRGW